MLTNMEATTHKVTFEMRLLLLRPLNSSRLTSFRSEELPGSVPTTLDVPGRCLDDYERPKRCVIESHVQEPSEIEDTAPPIF